MNNYLQLLIAVALIPFYWLLALYRIFFPVKKNVKGELVLITGGASGIGRLMAIEFAKLGSEIVLWDVNKEGLEKVSKEIKTHGVRCFTYVCDISDRNSVYKCADRVRSEAGDVSILINNAGIVTGKPLLECSDEKIEKTFQVNTIAHFWTAKAFVPRMLERNHGHLVTIASNAGLVGVAGLADYCASKFGAYGFDESMRFEFKKQKKDGVKTTCVCPYYINTGMFDGASTKVPLLLPILEPEWVVKQVMDAILTNREVLVLPKFANVVFLGRLILPIFGFDSLITACGASDTMDDFKGRQKRDQFDLLLIFFK